MSSWLALLQQPQSSGGSSQRLLQLLVHLNQLLRVELPGSNRPLSSNLEEAHAPRQGNDQRHESTLTQAFKRCHDSVNQYYNIWQRGYPVQNTIIQTTSVQTTRPQPACYICAAPYRSASNSQQVCTTTQHTKSNLTCQSKQRRGSGVHSTKSELENYLGHA